MNALAFLIKKKCKNSLKQFIRKPTKIIFFVFFVLFVGLQLVNSSSAHMQDYLVRDIGELYAIVFAFYTLMYILVAGSGFSTGASMFTMPDVNLLFLTPIKQKSILNYGLVQGLGKSILSGIFILFQSWILYTYDVSFIDLIAIIVGYALVLFLAQMTAMIIYPITRKSDEVKRKIKAVCVVVVSVFAVYMIYNVMMNKENALGAAVESANSMFMAFFPVTGFLKIGVEGFISNDYAKLGICFAAIALFISLCYFITSKIKFDFYEDVLQSTEIAHSAIKAQKEGKIFQEAVPKNIKVGKTGLNSGEGASAIFAKQEVESRRRKVFIVDTLSLISIVITLGFTFFTRNLFSAVGFSVYMMLLFGSANSSFVRELSLPYIYLIPENPMPKLFNAIKREINSIIVESILVFVPIYFLIKPDINEFLIAILLRISFGTLFLSVNLFFGRFFGTSRSTDFGAIMFFFGAMIACVPAIVMGVLTFNFISDQMIPCLVAAVITNFVMSLGLTFVSRNLLKYADY